MESMNRVVDAVWGFFAAYVGVFVVLMVAVMAAGLDQVTAFSAVAACLNNLGPGLGEVHFNYGDINACFCQITGDRQTIMASTNNYDFMFFPHKLKPPDFSCNYKNLFKKSISVVLPSANLQLK